MDGPAILLILTVMTGPHSGEKHSLPLTTPTECAEQVASFIEKHQTPSDEPMVYETTCRIRLGPTQ